MFTGSCCDIRSGVSSTQVGPRRSWGFQRSHIHYTCQHFIHCLGWSVICEFVPIYYTKFTVDRDYCSLFNWCIVLNMAFNINVRLFVRMCFETHFVNCTPIPLYSCKTVFRWSLYNAISWNSFEGPWIFVLSLHW